MTPTSASLQQRFRQLVMAAVEEALRSLATIKAAKHYIGPYYGWTEVSISSNGLPTFSKPLLSGPPDYTKAFGPDSPLKTDDLTSFRALADFLSKEEAVCSRVLPLERANDTAVFFVMVSLIPLDLADRFIHVNNTLTFSEPEFNAIYEPFARMCFLDSLSFDLYIPILFVLFDFDSVALDNRSSIEKMDRPFQLSRSRVTLYGSGVHESVLPGASHSLVLRDRCWDVNGCRSLHDEVHSLHAYPLDLIDAFFAALRVVTNAETGYAQIIVRPKDWAINYCADLPPLCGTSLRRYPDRLDNFAWLREPPLVLKGAADRLGKVYRHLASANDKRLRLAWRRLNLCFSRSEEEDRILDVTIALEALLADNEPQEISHKISLRMAALSKLDPNIGGSPASVLRSMKKIYRYRSAVVHGTEKAPKLSSLEVQVGKRVSTTELAIWYLRRVLLLFADRPSLLDPQLIDDELLLGWCSDNTKR